MKYVPYILIAVLVGVILFNRREVEVREICTTDTVVVHKIDTFVEEKPICKYRTEVDTFYVYVEGKPITLPKESKQYSKDGVYDAWVSGHRPSLDSIRTYNRTEYRDIIHNIETVKYKNRWETYLECGFKASREVFYPSVGISITAPKKMKIGAELGVWDKSFMFGISVGYKLNK